MHRQLSVSCNQLPCGPALLIACEQVSNKLPCQSRRQIKNSSFISLKFLMTNFNTAFKSLEPFFVSDGLVLRATLSFKTDSLCFLA